MVWNVDKFTLTYEVVNVLYLMDYNIVIYLTYPHDDARQRVVVSGPLVPVPRHYYNTLHTIIPYIYCIILSFIPPPAIPIHLYYYSLHSDSHLYINSHSIYWYTNTLFLSVLAHHVRRLTR